MKFENLYVGQSYSMTKSFSSEEVERFAEISGDNNLMHIDKEYAENSMFHGRIVHGFAVFGHYWYQDAWFGKHLFGTEYELQTACLSWSDGNGYSDRDRNKKRQIHREVKHSLCK